MALSVDNLLRGGGRRGRGGRLDRRNNPNNWCGSQRAATQTHTGTQIRTEEKPGGGSGEKGGGSLFILYVNEARKYDPVYYNLSPLCTCLIVAHLSSNLFFSCFFKSTD